MNKSLKDRYVRVALTIRRDIKSEMDMVEWLDNKIKNSSGRLTRSTYILDLLKNAYEAEMGQK